MQLGDYVVAHAAVHLAHRNHVAALWRTLSKLVSDVDAGDDASVGEPWDADFLLLLSVTA